jgi:GNAT superfamily N-acetyltransferase
MQIIKISSGNAHEFAPLLKTAGGTLSETQTVLAWGAVEDEKPAGILIAARDDGDLLLQNLLVSADYQRKGFGSALVQAAIDYSRENQFEGIRVEYSLPENDTFEVDLFYVRNGFLLPTPKEGEENVRKTYYLLPQLSSFNREYGNAVCVPKLNGLIPLLEAQLHEESELQLVEPEEGAPYLTFYVDAAEQSVSVELRYTVLEPETQDAFVLGATAEVAVSDVAVSEKIAATFNNSSLAAFAIPEDDAITLRAGLTEGAIPDEDSILVFLRLFIRGIRDIAFGLGDGM